MDSSCVMLAVDIRSIDVQPRASCTNQGPRSFRYGVASALRDSRGGRPVDQAPPLSPPLGESWSEPPPQVINPPARPSRMGSSRLTLQYGYATSKHIPNGGCVLSRAPSPSI
jgi:hypothetical protein